jgi:hypothetical protein
MSNSNWLDLSSTSNRFVQTYVQGFVDMSGGNLILRNNNLIVETGDVSLNGRLFIEGDVSMGGRLYVGGLTTANSVAIGKPTVDSGYALDISGDINFAGDVSFGGSLSVTNLSIGGVLQQNPTGGTNPAVTAFTTETPLIYAQYSTTNTFTNTNTFLSDTYFQGDVSMGARVFVVGDVSTSGNLFVSSYVGIGQTQPSPNGYALDVCSANTQGYGAQGYGAQGYGAMRIYESVKGTEPSAQGGTLTLQHADMSGVSSVVFTSTSNPGKDYGSVAYYDTVYGTPYDYYNNNNNNNNNIGSSSALVLSCQRDDYNATDPSSVDSVIIQAAGSVIVDASSLGQTLIQPRGGTVGIGKTNPNTTYALDVSGIVSCTYSATTSDYRIKDNVRDIPAEYSIDDLHPCSYYNMLAGKEEVGFLAHEVQEKFPFLVCGEKDGPEHQSLNYIGIIGLLVREIQELKRLIRDT